MGAVLFGEYMDTPSGWFHREWINMINDDRFTKVCIVAPRGHAKSTNVDFIWTIWAILFTDHHYIVAISNTFMKAEKMILQPIKDAFDNNMLLRELFGDVRGERWKQTELEFNIPMANGEVSRKKLDIAGVGQSIRGMRYLQYRPDVIIADDIEDDEQVKSAARRLEIREWFWKQAYFAMKKDKGEDGLTLACRPKNIVIGTILHSDSFLNNIIEMTNEDKRNNKIPDWNAKLYSQIYNDEKGVPRVLWEERDTMESVLAEREEAKRNGQESAWVQERLNMVMADGDRPVNIDCLQFYDNLDNKILSYYVAVDLALSGGSRTSNERDYNVVMCLGVDMSNGDMYVVDYKKFQTNDVNLTVNNTMDMAYQYFAKKIVFEKGSFQGSIEVLLQQEMKRRGDYFRIEGKSHGNMGKSDRIRMTVAYYVNRKKIFVKKEMRDLYDEMYEFPSGKHDDILDALTYAIVGADPKFISFKDYASARHQKTKTRLQEIIEASDRKTISDKSPYRYI